MMRKLYSTFYAQAFGKGTRTPHNEKTVFTSHGTYLRRHKNKYIFLFCDFVTGQFTVAASAKNQKDIAKQKVKLIYDDFDLVLSSRNAFRPNALKSRDLRIGPLSKSDSKQIKSFYKKCGQADIDTLDLTFKRKFALGLYRNEEILGIARAAHIKRIPRMVDITVLLARSARGRGLSTPLVSALVKEILARRLVPKYRVASNNMASLAVADRLGFTVLGRLLTLRRKRP
jgi:RimJ/RimL family protein N-acetyltransferase